MSGGRGKRRGDDADNRYRAKKFRKRDNDDDENLPLFERVFGKTATWKPATSDSSSLISPDATDLIDPTSTAVLDLPLARRAGALTLLRAALSENAAAATEPATWDVQEVSREVEHRLFSKSSTATGYRTASTGLLVAVRAATRENRLADVIGLAGQEDEEEPKEEPKEEPELQSAIDVDDVEQVSDEVGTLRSTWLIFLTLYSANSIGPRSDAAARPCTNAAARPRPNAAAGCEPVPV